VSEIAHLVSKTRRAVRGEKGHPRLRPRKVFSVRPKESTQVRFLNLEDGNHFPSTLKGANICG
jgi:hypothetical protein